MKIVNRPLLILTAIWLLMLSQLSHARHAALLIDADSGNVLYELEANQSWYPASLTKLMTLYMTFYALESGSLRLSHEMNVSSHASSQPTSKLGLRTWETISVEDAILAIITRSANDAAVVLAEEIAGSEDQFAIKMTSIAHGIGMYGSHFMNATGLPHEWQTTTAHDMALLALKIKRDFPQYYPYFASDGMYFRGREYRGINKFTANYPGAEGMKTGYTCGSGYNLVASAQQGGKHLIGVVLGGKSSSERYEHMFTMMDSGFSDPYNVYSSKNIDSMNKYAVGTPPYQLSCGHRPTSHYAARHIEDEDDHHVRYVKKSSHGSYLASHHKPIASSRAIKSGKTKTLAKMTSKHHSVSKSMAKSSHTNSKSKVASVSSKYSKKSLATSKSNRVAKADSKTLTVASKSKSKGYFSPTSSKKTITSKSSGSKKKKSSHKTETSDKTVAKNTSKSKHTTKSKS